jgi:phytoene synthase
MATQALSLHAAAVRRYDPDRFFTALFAPPEKRDVLMLLYAFNHELARAREVASEPMLALIRLQWWREVVEGGPRRHELATPLTAALEAGHLSRDDLLAMIEGREMEAEPAIQTLAEWRTYIDLSAGMLAVAAGRALGADEAVLERLRAVGSAYGVGGVLRSVTVRARAGRCLLPLDVLGAHGVTGEQVLGSPTFALPALRELTAIGRGWLASGLGRYDRPVLAAALPGVFAGRDLRRTSTIDGQPRGLSDRLAVLFAAATGRIRV